MSKFASDFLRILDERGFIHQGSDLAGLDEQARTSTVTAYVDPTKYHAFGPDGRAL